MVRSREFAKVWQHRLLCTLPALPAPGGSGRPQGSASVCHSRCALCPHGLLLRMAAPALGPRPAKVASPYQIAPQDPLSEAQPRGGVRGGRLVPGGAVEMPGQRLGTADYSAERPTLQSTRGFLMGHTAQRCSVGPVCQTDTLSAMRSKVQRPRPPELAPITLGGPVSFPRANARNGVLPAGFPAVGPLAPTHLL